METTALQTVIEKPLFDPSYLNIEYLFHKIVDFIVPIYNVVIDPHTWSVLGLTSNIFTIIFLAIIKCPY